MLCRPRAAAAARVPPKTRGLFPYRKLRACCIRKTNRAAQRGTSCADTGRLRVPSRSIVCRLGSSQ